MYCHYIGWCIDKCPLYRGVLNSECPLSEVPLYIYTCTCILKESQTNIDNMYIMRPKVYTRPKLEVFSLRRELTWAC